MAICAPVAGEQLPETTSNLSTAPGGGMETFAESAPSAFQRATSAYSTPDEPTTKSGGAWFAICSSSMPTRASARSSAMSIISAPGFAARA